MSNRKYYNRYWHVTRGRVIEYTPPPLTTYEIIIKKYINTISNTLENPKLFIDLVIVLDIV